jgi:hypothetical protein
LQSQSDQGFVMRDEYTYHSLSPRS